MGDDRSRTPNGTSNGHSDPIKRFPSPPKQDPHPAVQSFYLPTGVFGRILAIPSQILFALMGLVGMAHYARQIVRVRPRKAGAVVLNKTTEGAEGADGAMNVDEWIVKNTPSLNGTYKPAWWLPNGHLQTFFIISGDFSKTDKVDYVRTTLRVPDGGTLAVDITPPNHEELPADAPTVLVCHGLTGNASESYVRNVLAWVIKPKSEGGLGGRGVVSNFRGCGGQPVTSTQFYSAAASVDVNTISHYVRHRFPQSAVHGIGFSLGAGALARYLGESGEDSQLSSGCMIGCPWDMPALSHSLEDGWFSSRVYSSALGVNLMKMFFRNYDANPALFEDPKNSRVHDVMHEFRRLRDMGSKIRLYMVDEFLTSRVGGPSAPWPFNGFQEYYNYASSHKVIHNIKVPSLGINAFDDPVVHGEALPVEQVQNSSHVHLAVTGSGGHLGWFDSPSPYGPQSKSRWVRTPIAEFLSAAARDLPPRPPVAVVQEEDGWEYVDAPPAPTQLDADPARIGWRVLMVDGHMTSWEEREREQGKEGGKESFQGL